MKLAFRRFLECWTAVALLALCVSADAQVQRVPNTTMVLPEAPPTHGYTSTNAFPGLIFTNPICIVSPPGETNRLFVVSKNGVVTVITNLAAPNDTTFMDLTSQVSSQDKNSGTAGERGLLGMAFHPGFSTNGYFFLIYMPTNSAQGGYYDRLARFHVSSADPNHCNTNTQVVFYDQTDPDPNHDAGDLHFGADGYLYISVGDEGREHDGFNCAQIITNDLFSGILRIDVDKRAGNLAPNAPPSTLAISSNYLIPADNPFIGISSFNGQTISPGMVRTEFYAVGLRNPWRWNFDFYTNSYGTNVLYCGDVGQDHYEEVDVIEKGGNYGWAYWEGTNVASGGSLPHTTYIATQGTNIRFPIVHYAHGSAADQGNCVIGGVVYRGSNLPQLYGQYIYADYVDGNVWSLPASDFTAAPASVNGAVGPGTPLIADGSLNITAFGTDPRNGDVLFCATKTTGYATAATINKIVYNSVTNGAPLPPTLADTGAFTNLMSLTSPLDALEPAPGILPYTINLSFWSDNALKSRWFSLPDTNQTIGFSPNSNWSFPTGTVWIKNFNLELTNGDPASAIRLETRFIVKNDDGVYGVTYRWDGSQTNAALVPEDGTNDTFVINDGGILRTQLWHYPSRQECLECHTPAGGFGLGFRTEQFNCDLDYGYGPTNEIEALSAAGYFTSPVTNDVHSLLALATPTNAAYSLEFRSRSFLMANCSQCHQPAGTVHNSSWDARITTPTALAGLINGELVNHLGDPSNRVIVPQSPEHSVLLTRDATRDGFGDGAIQMPPIDSTLVDSAATNVMTQWILSMTNMFWIGASPDPATVVPGNNTIYTIQYVATPDFAGSVTLSVSNLPPDANASFSPANLSGTSTNSTLTITTSGSTPDGTYPLTVFGISGGVTNSDTMTLEVISNIVYGQPGTMLWTGNSGSDDNWVTSLNWTNLTAGGYGPPSTNNNVVFNDTATSGMNVVNFNDTINSLTCEQTNGIHHTVIPSGVTLSLNANGGNNPGGLAAGQGTPTALVRATNIISGGGTLVLASSGALNVSQGASQDDAHNVVLDMSGLGTFIINGPSQGFVAVGGGGYSGTSKTRACGTLYLARTNLLVMKYNFRSGDITGPASPNTIAIYLGQTNSIVLGNNNDDVSTGYGGGTNLLAFAPGLVDPTAYFRSTYSGTAPRVPTWNIGNASAAACVGTDEFSGGVIDAMANDLRLGRAASGANPALGVLTFDGGTFDANTIEDGWQTVSGGGTGAGIINVNSNELSGTFGTLVVNSSLTLGEVNGALTTGSAGTLNINGGLVLANSIIAGGGNATVTMNQGTLILTNTAGSPGARLTTFGAINSTLRLRLDGSAITTNIATANLIAGGANMIAVDSVFNVGSLTTFPIISYTGSTPADGTFVNGELPPGLAANLVNNTSQKRIDLVIVPSASVTPRINEISLLGTNLMIGGTNGFPDGYYYVLASTNLAMPLNQWLPVSTNPFDMSGGFSFTNRVDPAVLQMFYLLQLR